LERTFFHAAKAEVEKDLASRKDYKVRRVTILIIRICNNLQDFNNHTLILDITVAPLINLCVLSFKVG
jgi:hypothetical protein